MVTYCVDHHNMFGAQHSDLIKNAAQCKYAAQCLQNDAQCKYAAQRLDYQSAAQCQFAAQCKYAAQRKYAAQQL